MTLIILPYRVVLALQMWWHSACVIISVGPGGQHSVYDGVQDQFGFDITVENRQSLEGLLQYHEQIRCSYCYLATKDAIEKLVSCFLSGHPPMLKVMK